MRTKLDKALCEAYANMMSTKQTVKTLTEDVEVIKERQEARSDKKYTSVMESYQSVVCENKGLDKYRKFLQDTYGVSTFMQLPADKKSECKAKWDKIKTEDKAKKDEDDMIKENSLLERAAQIKAKDSKLSWVEARKKAEAEVADEKPEDKVPETEEEPIEEGNDKGSINPPKDPKASIETMKKVKKEEEDEEIEETKEEEEEIEETKKEKEEEEESIEEGNDKGSINPPKDLEATIEKIKKTKKEEAEKEIAEAKKAAKVEIEVEDEEDDDIPKKSFKEIAEQFLKEASDDKKKVIITLNKKVTLPKAWSDKINPKQSSQFWAVSEIRDILDRDLNYITRDVNTTNKAYEIEIEIPADADMDDISRKVSDKYWRHLEKSPANKDEGVPTFGYMKEVSDDEKKSAFEKIFKVKKVIEPTKDEDDDFED